MFKEKFIRNILLLSFAILLIFPLYNIFIAYPSFISALKEDVKEESIRTANHLLSLMKLSGESLQYKPETIEAVKKSFNLIKIKVFSPSGKTTYSTNPKDMGNLNKKKYFHEIVAKGNPYVKIVEKNTKSLEGQLMAVDNVETYVPIMNNGKFLGAFEIYYDVTKRKARFNKLRIEATVLVIVLAFVLLIVVSIISFKASRTIAERKKADEELQKSSFYLDSVSDSIIIVNTKREIIRVNREFSKLWGYSSEEVIGKPVSMVFPEEDMPKHLSKMNEGINTKKAQNFETIALTKSGEKIPLSIRGSAIFDKDGKPEGFIGMFRDITERKKSEETIQSHINRLDALHSIEKAITSGLDLRFTLDVLLTHVTTQLGIDAASVLLLNKQTQILEYVASKGFRSSALKYTKLKLGESNAGRTAIERRIVTIPDLKGEPGGFIKSGLFINEDFITYFAVPLIAKGEVKGVLELFHRTPLAAEPEWLEFLETVADQAAIAIDNAALFEGLQRSNVELTHAYDTTIEGWSRAMDLRDKETEGHSQRVTDLTLRIAKELGVKDEDLVHIRRGALLHDLGKIGIPDNILLKPGRLTEEEWVIMKNHPVIAYDMLNPIEYLRPALDIPYCHHEKRDGSGYPRGLKGEEIPLAARIFTVVDVWDALRSDRPYRPAWPMEKTLEHIKSLSGTHFYSKVIEVFLKMEL